MKKQWKRSDGLKICIPLGLSSAEQAVQEATEVQSPDRAHSITRVYLAFEQQGTQLTSLQNLEAPCSTAIPALRWETHSFLTMILNSSRHPTQQGKEIKVKKKSVFLLSLGNWHIMITFLCLCF